jgi:3-isopropylmalate dehydratase small subunit
MKILGRCWVFRDNIDTDVILPTQYLLLPDVRSMSVHAFEPLRPNFVKEVKKGDVIVAGKNFGCGSSREQAPAVLKELGVAAIVAKSFARIFYRNSINLGLPVIECSTLYGEVEEGDILEIDLENGVIINKRTGKIYKSTKIPEYVMDIIRYGGLVEYMKQVKEV